MNIVSGASLVARSRPIWKKATFSSRSVAVIVSGTTFAPSNHTSTKPLAGSRDHNTCTAKSCQRPGVSLPLPTQWSLYGTRVLNLTSSPCASKVMSWVQLLRVSK
jgi:hypothetical protein